jgi:hypothetical protein
MIPTTPLSPRELIKSIKFPNTAPTNGTSPNTTPAATPSATRATAISVSSPIQPLIFTHDKILP